MNKTNQQIAAEIIESDFVSDKYDTYGKTCFRRFKKLTPEQIEKYFEASKYIGYEMEFLKGSKVRKCILLAVTLPSHKVIAYPHGEIHEMSGKEFATKYSSHYFDFRVSLLDKNGDSTYEYWSSKIDNLDLTKVGNQLMFPELFKNMEEAQEKYV